MSHFLFLDGVDGVWTNGQNVTPTQFTLLDQQLFHAVDGDKGGAWAPSAPIHLAGEDIEVDTAPSFVRAVSKSVVLELYGAEAPGLDAAWWWGFPFQSPNDTSHIRARAQAARYDVPLHRHVHNGATLANVRLYFVVGAVHAAVPASMPYLFVQRSAGDGAWSNIHSVTGQMSAPASGDAWYAAGALQTFDVPCSPDLSVIDSDAYLYRLTYLEESGVGAFAGRDGNYLVGARLDFTNIVTMAFP